MHSVTLKEPQCVWGILDRSVLAFCLSSYLLMLHLEICIWIFQIWMFVPGRGWSFFKLQSLCPCPCNKFHYTQQRFCFLFFLCRHSSDCGTLVPRVCVFQVLPGWWKDGYWLSLTKFFFKKIICIHSSAIEKQDKTKPNRQILTGFQPFTNPPCVSLQTFNGEKL